jgi:ssDNA thymidine ADP-ribosyltransferase, DarT
MIDPNFVQIGNPDLIGKRRDHPVDCPMGGTLSDYVPFYFTPKSPMLYNIKTGYNGIRQRSNDEIAIFVSSIHRLHERQIRYAFTDRHAYLAAANCYTDPAELENIDWKILQNHDFKRSADDLDKVERDQAEALVYRHLPVDALLGIACHSKPEKERLQEHVAERGLATKIVMRQDWYF